jgi:hypothetical protein
MKNWSAGEEQMAKQGYRSKCCNAEVRTEGVPDFIGSKEICTVSYVCLKCNRSCDVVESRKISAAKKRIIQALKKRVDFQGKILQKLVEFLDGITIHPTKGVILTPKKKCQLAELQKMEQKLLKSKAKKSR